MSESVAPILAVAPMGKYIESILSHILDETGKEGKVCATSQDILDTVIAHPRSVILCSVADRDQIVKAITLLKLVRPQLVAGTLKFYVITQIRRSDVIDSLMKYGCTEVVHETASQRAFSQKLIRICRYLGQQSTQKSKNLEVAREVESQRPKDSSSSSRSSVGKNPDKQKTELRMDAPLSIRSDCWLYRMHSAKRVMGRWVIRLVGPGPISGKWVQNEDPSIHPKKQWIWVPTPSPEGDAFIQIPGMWIYEGNRPEFQDEAWFFSGEAIQMWFENEGNILGVKFAPENEGGFKVAEDSEYALQLLMQIKQSIAAVVHFHGNESEKSKTEIEMDAPNPDEGPSIEVSPPEANLINDRRGETGAEPKRKNRKSTEISEDQSQFIRIKLGKITEKRKKRILSPLLIGIMIAEWMGDSSRTAAEISHFYCACVKSLVQAVEVEFWAQFEDELACIGKTHTDKSRYHDFAQEVFSSQGEVRASTEKWSDLQKYPVCDLEGKTVGLLAVKSKKQTLQDDRELKALAALGIGVVRCF